MDSMLKMELRALIGKYGYSRFWQDIKELNRERISKDRPKREHFPKSTYQKLADRQKGFCVCGCEENLLVPATRNHVDHFDPHETTTFNSLTNLRLLLPNHNLSKSSKSIEQLSKEGKGTTLAQIKRSQLTREAVDPNEL